MDAILRAAATYLAILIIMRISGKRSLSQITTFDFILLLIIGNASQQALLGNDFSVTNAALIVVTLLGMEIAFSFLADRSPLFGKMIDSVPLIILEDGVPIKERMNKSRVGENEILAQARKTQGLERLDQIKYAVLERDGGISIIPKPEAKS